MTCVFIAFTFMLGAILLVIHKRSALMILICLEILCVISYLFLMSGYLPQMDLSVSLFFFVFSVIEAVLGLAFVVSMAMFSGSEGLPVSWVF